jgi:hypothetical protein
VLSYIKQHGGGTLAISSQTGAETAVRQGSDVAGIGGFSGRESAVTVAWLKQAVAEGRIRWVLADGEGQGGRGPQDGRTGAQTVMDWVRAHGKQVTSAGLYDLSSLSATSQEPS